MWSAADENPYGMELYEFIYRTGYGSLQKYQKN